VKQWQTADDPLKRLQLWLERKDLWSAAQDQATRDDERLQVMAALEVSTYYNYYVKVVLRLAIPMCFC
jgi:TPP-dependent pyruvate/acetoin dehydrogenase alpha subunit